MKKVKDMCRILLIDAKLLLIKIKINIICLRIAWDRAKEKVNLI